jgi:hypothetical protein
MTKLYLAGKITKNGWRHKLVPGLRYHTYTDGPIVCNRFTYVGPFFVGCDHGCYHVPTGHGSINNALKLCGDDFSTTTREEVRSHCFAAIDDCDILLAWINAHRCYGTIAEIQYALTQGKKVVVAFAPQMASASRNEFWFVSIAAHWVRYDVGEKGLAHLVDGLWMLA